MIYSAGDLGIEIDLGTNEHGAVLQRKKSGSGWVDYLIDGSQVRGPVGVQTRSEATLRPWRSLLTTHTRE